VSRVPRNTVEAVGTLVGVAILACFLVVLFCSCAGLIFHMMEGS
jgi:hypothetical protein